jgi:hypothetical protein
MEVEMLFFNASVHAVITDSVMVKQIGDVFAHGMSNA